MARLGPPVTSDDDEMISLGVLLEHAVLVGNLEGGFVKLTKEMVKNTHPTLRQRLIKAALLGSTKREN